MSQIIYNGVTLNNLLTERVEQTPEFDPTGVDQTNTLFTISAQSILYPGVGSVNVGEDPAAAMVRLRHMLITPRKDFRYTVNGIDVINSSGRDDANGPETSCTYTQLSPGSFLVAFTCKVRLTDCSNAAGRSYLSLKWSDTLTYDSQWLAGRRRVGTLVLSTRRTTDPDSLRPIVTPDVPSGFRRESADYTLSEDGRIVRFNFLDKQLVTPPPFPAVRMQGIQVEAAAPPGAIRTGQVQLRLTGAKGTSKRDLLNAAVVSVMSRVYTAGFQANRSERFIGGWSVSEGLGDTDNWVEVSVNWRLKPEQARKTNSTRQNVLNTAATTVSLFSPSLANTIFGPVPNKKGANLAGLSTPATWVGKDLPNSDPNRAIATPTYGAADQLKLVAAALNDPCGQDNELVSAGFDDGIRELRTAPFPFPAGLDGAGLAGNKAPGVATSGGAAFSVQVIPAEQIPPDDTAAAYQNDGDGTYDEYTLIANYKNDSGVVVLPSTKSGEKAMVVRLRNPTLTMSLEWTAIKVGGEPILPAAEDGPGANAILTRSTISPAEIGLAADGVSTRYEVSGIYEFSFLDPSKATIQAPLPPFLSCSLADDARRIVSFKSDCIAFPNKDGTVVNPFTGDGVSDVECCGTTTSELVSVGGFRPDLGAPVRP